MRSFFTLYALLCSMIAESQLLKRDHQNHHHNQQYHHGTGKYTNRWVIEVSDDHPDTPITITDELDLHYHGPVGSLRNYHVVEHKTLSSGLNMMSDKHHKMISGHHKVVYAKQEQLLSRRKRYSVGVGNSGTTGKVDPMFSQQWFLKNTGKDI